MGGYVEERVVAWIRLGQLTNDPGCFLEAAVLNGTRQEPWWELFQWARDRLPEIADVALRGAIERNDPSGMFLDTSIAWRVSKEIAMQARDLARAEAKRCLSIAGAETDERVIEAAAD